MGDLWMVQVESFNFQGFFWRGYEGYIVGSHLVVLAYLHSYKVLWSKCGVNMKHVAYIVMSQHLTTGLPNRKLWITALPRYSPCDVAVKDALRHGSSCRATNHWKINRQRP